MIIADIDPREAEDLLRRVDAKKNNVQRWIEKIPRRPYEFELIRNELLNGMLANMLKKPVPRYERWGKGLRVMKVGEVNFNYLRKYPEKVGELLASFHRPFKIKDKIYYMKHGDIHPTNVTWEVRDGILRPWLIDLEFAKVVRTKEELKEDVERMLKFYKSAELRKSFLEAYERYLKQYSSI